MAKEPVNKKGQKVRFIRKNGRVIPIKVKAGSSAGGTGLKGRKKKSKDPALRKLEKNASSLSKKRGAAYKKSMSRNRVANKVGVAGMAVAAGSVLFGNKKGILAGVATTVGSLGFIKATGGKSSKLLRKELDAYDKVDSYKANKKYQKNRTGI
jgi:hypothetical protein